MNRALMEIAVEPKGRSEDERLHAALVMLGDEDAALTVARDYERGLTILGGADDLHLVRVIDRLKREFGVAMNVGEPQVVYRECLMAPVAIDYTHKLQSGASGQFARVFIRFEPGAPDTDVTFSNLADEAAVPDAYVPGVRTGIEKAAGDGVLAGFPFFALHAILLDGAHHDVDSSVLAFELAGRGAVRRLRDKGDIRLFEPVMRVSVEGAAQFRVAVLRLLLDRRGKRVRDMSTKKGSLTYLVPLANLFGFQGALRSATGAKGTSEMSFSHYAEVPDRTPPDDIFPPAVGMRA